jgi:hypothetical protein
MVCISGAKVAWTAAVRFYHSKWFRRVDAVAFAMLVVALAWKLI